MGSYFHANRMKTALYFTLILLALAVTGGVLVVTYDLHQDLAAAHGALQQATATVSQLDGTIAKVNKAADTLNDAATEERANWKATSKETAKTARDVRELVDDFRKSALHVNLVTLPAIDSQIATNGDQLALTLKKLGGTADGVTALTGTLNARLDDPAIPELLGHFNATAANLETISANGAAMSGDMKLAVHRMAQPPTKLHQALSVAWTTAKFGSLFVP